jgi:hypothetical protein
MYLKVLTKIYPTHKTMQKKPQKVKKKNDFVNFGEKKYPDP